MLYTILGERMTAGRAWDAFVNQDADDFMHHQEQTEDALSDFVARYATDVPSLFGWDTDAIRWTSDDTDAIAVAMLAYLEGLGYL